MLCPVFWQPLTKPTDTVHQPQRAWQISRGGKKYDHESDVLPGLDGAMKVHRRREGKVLPQEFFPGKFSLGLGEVFRKEILSTFIF